MPAPFDLTLDEWVIVGILTFIIYAVGLVPKLAERLFGGPAR